MIIPFPGSDRVAHRVLSPAQRNKVVEQCLSRIASQCAHAHPDFDLGMSAGIDHFFAMVRPETIVTVDEVLSLICDNADEQAHRELMTFYASIHIPPVDFAYRLGFIGGWLYAARQCHKLPVALVI